MSESALKHDLLTISDNFFQFHQKNQKNYFLPISDRRDKILSESKLKHAFLTVSDDFFPVSLKILKNHFQQRHDRIDYICLNQHQNMILSQFLMIFPSFIKKVKKLIPPDIWQNWPYFVCISIKKFFSHDFWWFFPVSSKKGILSRFPTEKTIFCLNQH